VKLEDNAVCKPVSVCTLSASYAKLFVCFSIHAFFALLFSQMGTRTRALTVLQQHQSKFFVYILISFSSTSVDGRINTFNFNIVIYSRMELLEAMDIRLRALKEEQDTYFSRAAGAGFDSGSMAGLIAFAEYFGAERLR
jgi:hypothetical protein